MDKSGTLFGYQGAIKSAPNRGALLEVAVIYLAVLAAYFPALGGKLVMDDNAYLTQPPLRSLTGLGRIWFEVGATTQYSPVLHTAFWVEHALWGDSPSAYHLLNALMHATAACLFIRVLRSLRVSGAYFAGLIFALHPVCVESVAWISEQKNTLSTVFYLLATLTYLRFDDGRRPPAGGTLDMFGARGSAVMRSAGAYAWATLFFILAVLSKSVTATLPAAILVVLWWRRDRLEWRRDVIPLLPWFVLGTIGGLFSSWIERDLIGATGSDFTMGFIARGLVAGRAVWFYLAKLFWPINLVFIYPRWAVNAEIIWQYLFPFCLLALLVALWLLRKRSRAPLAAALIYVGTLFPTLGFLNVYFFIYSFVADHFQYLATFSIIALVAAGGSRWAATGRFSFKVAAIAALGALGTLTWRQCKIYGNGETLYTSILTQNPNCWMAHANLGNAWLDMPGRLNDAIKQYEEALHLKPDLVEAHYNLGNAWSRIPGRLNDAIAEYEEALRLEPNHVEAHTNLGNAWSRIPGRLNYAIAQYEEALRLDPLNADAHNNLGNVWLNMPGRLNDAIAQYEEALRLRPDFAKAHYNLGNAWSRIQGRRNDAIAQYEEALRINPEYADAHNNLGSIWARMPGRLNSAIAEYEETLRLKPDFAEAHYNLGNAWARMPGRLNDAITQYEEALRLDPAYAAAHNNLGNAWLNTPGRLNDAIAQYEEALRLDPAYAAAHNNLGNAWLNMPERLNDAIAQFEETLRLRPDFAEAHTNLGNAWSRIPGRWNDAITQFEEALRLQPDNAAAHFSLALALLKRADRSEEAKAHLETVLRLQPENDLARRILAGIQTPQP